MRSSQAPRWHRVVITLSVVAAVCVAVVVTALSPVIGFGLLAGGVATHTWESLTAEVREQRGAALVQSGDFEAEGPVPVAPEAVHDDAGAVAFARYWADAYEYSVADGDPRLLEESSTAACTQCARTASAIRLLRSDGVRQMYTSIDVTSAAVTWSEGDAAVVHLAVDVSQGVVTGPGGFADVGGGQTEDDLVLLWDDHGWRVDSVSGGTWTIFDGYDADGAEPAAGV